MKDSINNLFDRLQNSPLPRAENGRLASFFKKAYGAARTFPDELGGWRMLAERFRLDTSLGWSAILSAVTSMEGKGIDLPPSLASVPLSAGSLFARAHMGRMPSRLCGAWPAALTEGSSVDHLIRPRKFLTREPLALALKRHNHQFQQSGKLSCRIRDKTHLPSTFARLGPARKIHLVMKSDATPLQVSRFVAVNAQANLLKQVRGSLPGVTSAFRGCAAFFELIMVEPFPPQEETIIRWTNVFNDTSTFGDYISLMGKACFSPRFSTA